jgi:hypothetical protein
MIASAAVQKLERYGHLGLKRSTLEQFVNFSLRDEKQSNVFALTNITSWKECEAFLRSSQAAFVSEMLLYAMSFGVALVSNGGSSVPESIRLSLIQTWISSLTHLRRHMISDSLETTRACSHLCGTCLDMFNSTSSQAEHALRGELLSLVLQKMAFFNAKRPQLSLFHVKLLPAMLKSRLQQQNIKESLFQKIVRAAASVDADNCSVFVSASNLIKQLLANRPTRLLLYYRGDENKLLLSDVKDLGECNTALFAMSGPNAETSDYWLSSPARDEIERWAQALPVIFASFCLDSRWNVLATEQRRMVLESERIQKDHQRKAALEGKRLRRGEVGRDTASVDDDEARELSILETIDTAVMSEMSAASAASFVSFMSKVDPVQMKRGEILQHESGDGNTNLPLIFLEQILVTLHGIVPRLSSDSRAVCWRQTARMLSFLRDSINATEREGLPSEPLFDFARDVRYNRGLGYQSLGVIFAKVIVPYFESGVLRNADLYVGECLAVFEAVAPQVIDENLTSVLSIVTAAICEDATCSGLTKFLKDVVRRLAMTNQIDRLLTALFTAFKSANGAAARVFLRPSVGRSWLEEAVGFALDCETLMKDVSRRISAIANGERSESDSACISLCSAVIDGIRATSLSASSVVEACAEIDMVLSGFITQLVLEGGSSSLADCLLLLLSVRRQASLCLQDLGVDAVDEFVETLESTLWECEATGPAFLSGIPSLDSILSAVSDCRGKYVKCAGTRCVFLLAAQRLLLCNLVTVFLGKELSDKKRAKNTAKAVLSHILSSADDSRGEFAPFISALSKYAPRAFVEASISLMEVPSLQDALLNGPDQLIEIVRQLCTDAADAAACDNPTASEGTLVGVCFLAQLIRQNGGVPLIAEVIESHAALLSSLVEWISNNADCGTVTKMCHELTQNVASVLGDVLCLSQTSVVVVMPMLAKLFSTKSTVRRLLRCSDENSELNRFVVCVTSFLCSHEPSEDSRCAYANIVSSLKRALGTADNRCIALLVAIVRRNDIRLRPLRKRLRNSSEGECFDLILDLWNEVFVILVDLLLPDALTSDKCNIELLSEGISLLFDHLSTSSNLPSCTLSALQTVLRHTGKMSESPSGLGCIWRLVSLPAAQEGGLATALCSALSAECAAESLSILSGIIDASPTILRLHSSLAGAVQLVQRALSAGISAQQEDFKLFQQVVRILPRISGVHDVRIATFKLIIKESLAAACAADGSPSATVLTVWTYVSQLLLIPSAALHRDSVLETLALKFLLVILDRPVHCSDGWGEKPEIWNAIIRNVLSACSSSLLVHGALLQAHSAFLPLLVSTLTEHVLEGLKCGVYAGAIASLLVSFFYRLVKSAATHTRADELHWTICCTIARLLQSTSRYVVTFSRFSHELDSFATDMIKYLEKARLPADSPMLNTAVGASSVEHSVGHGENSYCDLAFVLIESSDGKNLFKDAALRAREQEHRVVFNAV